MIRANTLIKKHLWSLLVCITMMMTTLPISGQERYKVAWFNSQEITIGGKKIAHGMEFDSRAKVVFSDESQAFRAVDIKTKKCKVFSNHKIQNPRYSGHTKGLSTKSAFKVEATAEIPSIIPIVDTIFLPLPATTYYSKKAQWFIQFKSGDEWSEHRVFPSEDGGALLIPASVFHDSTIEPFYFSIYEKDLLGNWTYPLYEYLYAVPLPTK